MDIAHFVSIIAVLIIIIYPFVFWDLMVQDYKTTGKSVLLSLIAIFLLFGWWADCIIMKKITSANTFVFILAVSLYIAGIRSAIDDVRKYDTKKTE